MAAVSLQVVSILSVTTAASVYLATPATALNAQVTNLICTCNPWRQSGWNSGRTQVVVFVVTSHVISTIEQPSKAVVGLGLGLGLELPLFNH